MKIFGIGLSRTGTTSLSMAVSMLGWRSRHFPTIDLYNHKLRILPDELETFDALFDTPVAALYKWLDRLYPGSKFILTTRDIEQWLDSCASYPRFRRAIHISPAFQVLRTKLYGCLHFDRGLFTEAFLRHLKDARRHFASREGCFLEMNICNGEGWESLCHFLKVPISKNPFPHKNRRVPS